SKKIMIKTLIVDDDTQILNLIDIHLSREGYTVLKAKNGVQALEIAQKEKPTIAIVDVMMPKMDGFTLTKHLRSMDIPVLLLTAKGELQDKEKGFTAGSDDYVVKPFEPKELIFRIQAILRRYDVQTDDIIEVGDMKIIRPNYEVHIGNRTLYLPLKEFELLTVLASRVGHVFTRDVLIELVWGMDYKGDNQTVNVHVKRLREKMRDLPTNVQIKTMRGVGYKL